MFKVLRRNVLIVLVLALLAAMAPWVVVPAVVNEAERIAGDRPYCIVTSTQSSGWSYKHATSLADFAIGRMWAPFNSYRRQDTFHAVLYVELPRQDGHYRTVYERYNWTYWGMRFDPIVGQGHAFLRDDPDCTPRPHMATGLPVF